MTRLLMCGWETGDVNQIGSIAHNSTAPSAINTGVRSGAYSLKCWPNDSNGGRYSGIVIPHAPYTELYYAFGLYRANVSDPAAGNTDVCLSLVESAGAAGVLLLSESDGTLRAWRGTSNGGRPRENEMTLLGLCTQAVPLQTWTLIELRVVASLGTTGSCEVRVNGVPALSVTNVRTSQQVADLAAVRLEFYRLEFKSGNGASFFAFDDLRVNTTAGSVNNSWPGDGSIRALRPNGVGTTIGGTPLTGSGIALRSQGAAVTVINTSAGTAASITDGDDLTYWRSNTDVNANPWFYIDLGSAQQIDYFALYQSKVLNAQWATQYRIESSSDTTTWTLRYTSPTGLTAADSERAITALQTPASARYWRFYCLTGTGGDDWVIYSAALYSIDPAVPNWQNVDETPPSAADYNAGTAVGTGETYALTNPPTISSCAAINVITQAHNVEAGGGAIGITVKSPAGTSEGSAQPISASPTYYNRLLEADPSDSAAWTQAKLDALEAGITVR